MMVEENRIPIIGKGRGYDITLYGYIAPGTCDGSGSGQELTRRC